MNKPFNIRSRVWVFDDDIPFLGIGRVQLLENINEFGSITKGAEAMNMSYRKAWQLVENMNQMSAKPLVEKRMGGEKGGGATVTAEGKAVIKKYHLLQKKMDSYLTKITKEIKF